jgi:hypothetical protein
MCRLADRQSTYIPATIRSAGQHSWRQEVSDQPESSLILSQRSAGSAASVEDHPLVRSLRSILREIDDEYERECENLRRTLPDTNVKDRTLAMLKARHLQRRENYVRELSALLDGRE